MTVADAYFTHVTEQGTSFEIPEQWHPDPKQSACRSCQAPIVWCKTPRGKRAPVNPDGTSHFSTCPQADRWRKSGDASATLTIRQVVNEALAIGYEAPQAVAVVERVAQALVDELRADGMAIHETRLCVRPGDPEKLGRAMTEDEAREFLRVTAP